MIGSGLVDIQCWCFWQHVAHPSWQYSAGRVTKRSSAPTQESRQSNCGGRAAQWASTPATREATRVEFVERSVVSLGSASRSKT